MWFYRFSSVEPSLGETFPPASTGSAPMVLPHLGGGGFEETLCGNSNIASDIIKLSSRFWNFS